jgi:hypothetical protein
VWLPPAGSGAPSALDEPAVLPVWALRRLCTEYAEPGQPVVACETRVSCGEQHRVVFRALTGLYDPYAHIRPRGSHHLAVRLAILQVDTEPHTHAPGVPRARQPDQAARRATDLLGSVLRAAADTLEPGAILALALAAPQVGHGVQGGRAMICAARSAGLAYQQHIAVLTAALDGDQLIAHVTDAQVRGVNQARAAGIPASAPAHQDLTIFTKVSGNTLA